jgi:hypothetical protein
LMTRILTGNLYFTSVATSPMSIVKPPSTQMATICLSGNAAAAPTAYGTAFAMVASSPDAENFMAPRIST